MMRPSTDTASSPASMLAMEQRALASNTASQRLDAVSSGLKTRKLSGFRRSTSRR
jgi:hypothetical protein